MTAKGVLLSLLFLIAFRGYSQEPNDCVNAIAICGDIDFAYTPTGPGVDDFSSNPNPGCLTSDPVESQSVWLKLTIDTGGLLAFTFTPNNGTDDYDWAVYDMNNSSCNSLGAPVRCSSTMFLASSGGATGLGNGTTDTTEGPGTGDGFLAPINANSGDVFLVFINNWSSSTSGFDLLFSGTATFNPPPTENIPTGVSIDLETCDDDGALDGFTDFDLSINTPIIIGTQSGVSVTYHTTRGNAQIRANDIPDATNFQNTIFREQTVFARVTNTGTDCFSITDFEIEVFDPPIAAQPSDMIFCDDDNNGTIAFDLSSQDGFINSASGMSITYHPSQLDADTGVASNPLSSPYESGTDTIYVRLENDGNTDCYDTTSFEIEVFDTPIATQPMDLTLCDDDNNGVMAFDLSSQDGFINSASGMSISYHLSQLDADTGAASNPLSSPYESGIDTIYVRLENNGNTDCYDTTSFEIEVFELAFPLDSANIDSIEECDNISVGTDTDGFIVFDLTQRETDILNGQDSSVFTLTYFTDAGYTNQIPVAQETAFENTTAGGQTVYVRMTNNLNATCYDDTSFEMSVFELPVLNSPPFVLEQCDDDFDGYNSFNLTEINSEIITTITTEIFTYYESSAEAEAGIVGTEITNPTTYPNKTPNVDNDLWVRVETTGGCYRTTQATLIVKPSEILTSFIRTFSECDDGTDNRDGIATFDFSSVTAEVEAIFPTAVDVFYYRNEADATAEINEIVDPTAYENIGYEDMQEVWVRADSQLGNDCLGNGHHITLIVEKLPTANKPTDLTECDDDGDGEFPFDISMVETEILNGQSLADVTITYFNEDGTTIGSSLPNPFLTASQTIDIVITNNTTNDPEGVCTDKTTLTFVVDDSPEAATVIMAPSCDDNPNDTDGVSIFDTTSLESDILNSQTGMNVYYYDASGVDPLKDSNGVVITSPFPSSFSTATQRITVVVENPKNTTCTAITTVDFIVLPNPVYDLEEETLVCENLLPHRISVENPNQSNYNYQWFNSLGVEIGTDQILSIINTDDLTAEGVDYTVTVTNPITTCSKTKSILVRVSSLATITEDDIVTIEFNSPGNSIEINTTNLGIGDYEFSLEHDYDYQPFQDEPIFTGLLGGIYTLLVNDKIGCGEMELTIVLLDYPKFLTPNNDGYNDTWKLTGIESTSFTVSPIQIFDRFGKIVAILDPQSSGWDGYYNGIQLPASDYWFRVQLTNSEGTTLDEKGNFSLVRR